jgi:hypothetical protein
LIRKMAGTRSFSTSGSLSGRSNAAIAPHRGTSSATSRSTGQKQQGLTLRRGRGLCQAIWPDVLEGRRSGSPSRVRTIDPRVHQARGSPTTPLDQSRYAPREAARVFEKVHCGPRQLSFAATRTVPASL